MNTRIPDCYYRISVKALILDETRTKFLIIQENNGQWDMPGGGLDWGESIESGLRRELDEEMGLIITSITPNPIYFFTDKRKNGAYYANVFYEVVVRDLNFVPSRECVALRFVTGAESLELPLHSNVKKLAGIFDTNNHSLKH